MAFDKVFKEQADLMITVMGYMRWDQCFALKGGTALNLFYADMPRLSVDIDLVYLPLNSREEAVTEMKSVLKSYKEKFSKAGLQVQMAKGGEDNPVGKLIVSRGRASIKIEPNTIMRGTFYPVETKTLSSEAVGYFRQEVDVSCMSFKELMAGKLTAMLDRQHPRDIFDMMHFLKSGHDLKNFTDIFVAYLIQANRPFSELLRPNLKNIEQPFKSNFEGMTRDRVSIEELIAGRDKIIKQLPGLLKESYRRLLISIMEGRPEWQRLPFKNIGDYPGVQWKLLNIRKMSADRVKEEIRLIEDVFGA
jgi:predicted nucleotidyltransferase component of viral defense system